MKKIMTLAAIFAAVMMGFSACQPEDQPSTPGTEETPGTNEETPGTNEETPGTNEETPGEEEEATAAVTIDGNFEDWDNLEGVQVATLPEGDCEYEQLKTFKLYADEEFIYIFCEFDPENTLVFVPYFDLDGDPTTGNTSKWSGAGYEAKAEGGVFAEDGTEEAPVQGAPEAWDPEFYYYGESTDEVLASGMAVTSSVPAAYKGGSTFAFEASILRELVIETYAGVFDGTKTDSFTMGMIQYDLNWDYIGKLPCKTLAEKEAGELEPMLTVTLP